MSGLQVARKIDKAMTKVGAKIGFNCVVYRPDGYANPLQDKNIVSSQVKVAYSVDDAFVKNPVDELSHYKIYVSAAQAQVGDILLFDDGKTIVMTEMESIRTPSGILANDRISVSRSQATPLSDTKITLTELCSNVPCAIKIKSASTFSQPNVALSTGTTNLEIWTWMPANEIVLGDTLDWNSKRFIVNSVDATSKGTKLTATSTTKGR